LPTGANNSHIFFLFLPIKILGVFFFDIIT